MEIGKGKDQESMLHHTSERILFIKPVEVKHVAQRIKNMLNEKY